MKTSKEDFKIFKLECEKWIEFYGINGWMISFMHKNQDIDEEPHIAWIEADTRNMTATFYLNKEWVDDIDFYGKKEIRFVAFHEVCELLLTKLDDLANERFEVTPQKVLEARHEIIHYLENSVYKKLKTEV